MSNYPDGCRASDIDGDYGAICPPCGGSGTDSRNRRCELCDGQGEISVDTARTYHLESRE